LLHLTTLTGEQVYSQKAQGNQGLNTIVWDVKNNQGQPVASGLYVYLIQVDDGASTIRKSGKLVILH
jgi:hypothetical protein